MKHKYIAFLWMCTIMICAFSTISSASAKMKQVHKSHSEIHQINVNDFDVSGIKLGMSPEEVAYQISQHFGVQADKLYCQGCYLNYSTNPQSFDCDANTSKYGIAEEPYILLTESNIRLQVTFYHKSGSNTGPCLAYSIRFETGGYLPERDNAKFEQGLIQKYGNPTTKYWHDYYKFNDYFWCRKVSLQESISHCDCDYSTLSATIYTAAPEFQTDGLTAIIQLEDPSGPANASHERTLRETPNPSMHF